MAKKKSTGRMNRPKASDPWRDNPETVKRFIEQEPDYERLCDEVKYVLKKRIGDAGIEVSTIAARAKTLASFLEKTQRKSYAEPFTEIDDFAGVRVVCLYTKDIPVIEEVIRAEFDVVEKIDKLADKEPDQFGYGAIHFIVKLGGEMSGARYEDLKHLVCEVQVRTVLQDAWAIIDHHLVYKRESAIPKIIQRRLNGLAALFEIADDQFGQT